MIPQFSVGPLQVMVLCLCLPLLDGSGQWLQAVNSVNKSQEEEEYLFPQLFWCLCCCSCEAQRETIMLDRVNAPPLEPGLYWDQTWL